MGQALRYLRDTKAGLPKTNMARILVSRTLQSQSDLRPVYHRLGERIRAHVILHCTLPDARECLAMLQDSH